jgi:integrase
MASVKRRDTTRGSRYDVRYRNPSGKARMKTFRTRREADAYAANVEVDKARGTWIDPRLGRITFEDWVSRYLADARVSKRPTTFARDQWVLQKHFLPNLGSRLLSSITPVDVRRLVSVMAEHLAPATLRTNFGVLRAVFNAAIEADVIARSPYRGVKLPPSRRKKAIRFLDADELHRLADATRPEYRPMVYLAGVLGLRLSEVVALRVARLDLMRRTLQVVETIAEVNGVPVFGDVKSPAARRILEIPPFLVDLLAKHLAVRGLTAADGDALIFVGPAGGPLRRSNFHPPYEKRACRG